MRGAPSIVPEDPDREVYLVLDDFGGRLGMAWRETNDADTKLENLIEDLVAGQYSNPFRIVAFNTVEGRSRDVTEEIARELRDSPRSGWSAKSCELAGVPAGLAQDRHCLTLFPVLVSLRPLLGCP